MTVDEMKEAIIRSLEAELSEDGAFNEAILRAKVENAVMEVMAARKYPAGYPADAVSLDIAGFYSNIRNLALYDYNQVGVEFQSSAGEPSETRSYIDRNTLFSGVVPMGYVV